MTQQEKRIIKPEENKVSHPMTNAWAKSQECTMGREGTCGANCNGCTTFTKKHPVFDKKGRMIRI